MNGKNVSIAGDHGFYTFQECVSLKAITVAKGWLRLRPECGIRKSSRAQNQHRPFFGPCRCLKQQSFFKEVVLSTASGPRG